MEYCEHFHCEIFTSHKHFRFGYNVTANDVTLYSFAMLSKPFVFKLRCLEVVALFFKQAA